MVDKELRRLRATIIAEQKVELNGLAVKDAKKQKNQHAKILQRKVMEKERSMQDKYKSEQTPATVLLGRREFLRKKVDAYHNHKLHLSKDRKRIKASTSSRFEARTQHTFQGH